MQLFTIYLLFCCKTTHYTIFRNLGYRGNDSQKYVLKAADKNVLLGDGEDSDFWDNIEISNTKLIMLALPTIQDLQESMRQLKEAGYAGSVVAVAKYEDEKKMLFNEINILRELVSIRYSLELSPFLFNNYSWLRKRILTNCCSNY